MPHPTPPHPTHMHPGAMAHWRERREKHALLAFSGVRWVLWVPSIAASLCKEDCPVEKIGQL